MALDLSRTPDLSDFLANLLAPLGQHAGHSILTWAGVRAFEVIEQEEWSSLNLERLVQKVASTPLSEIPDWENLSKHEILGLIQAGIWKRLELDAATWTVICRNKEKPLTASNFAIVKEGPKMDWVALSEWRSQEAANRLLQSIKTHKPALQDLLTGLDYDYRDRLYRFYHQSFKVFHLQGRTLEIVSALQALLPERPLNSWFRRIVREGTGKEFNWAATNEEWLPETRPIVEAFLHARYFLEMAVKYADLEEAPSTMPSGWAAVLYLFDMR